MRAQERDLREELPHVKHGASCYVNYKCRCPVCKEGVRQKRQERWDNPTPKSVHGTANGYMNYGCRCARCTEAHTDYQRDMYQLRKQRQQRQAS